MRYIYLFAINLLLFSTAFSQKWEWAKSYGDWADQGGESIAVDNSNNIYIAGYDYYSTGGGPNPSGYWHQLLSKFDAAGNLLWVDTVPAFIHARVRIDGEGNAYLFNDPMFNNGKIAKYDSNGNLVWIKQVILRIIDDVAIASNGDIIVAGYNNLGSDEYLGSNLIPNNYGFIAKADKDLNWQWVQLEQLFGTHGLTVSQSNKIYVVGGCYGCADSSIVRIYDFNGNCIKKTVRSNMYVTMIAADNSENFYLAGNYGSSYPVGRPNQTIAGDTLHTNYSGSVFLYKFDSEGAVLWRKLIGQTVDVKAILTDKNSSVFISGNIIKYLEYDTILEKGYSEFYLGKFDNVGELVWMKHSTNLTPPIGSPGHLYGNSGSGVCDMALNTAGDPIITGAIAGKVAFDEHEVLANPGDWDDLLIAKIYQDPVKVTENSVGEQYSFAVYPNPSSGIFTLQYHGNASPITISVRNQLGQLIISKNFGTKDHLNETLNLSGYSNGVYFIEFQSGEAKEVHKLVIE